METFLSTLQLLLALALVTLASIGMGSKLIGLVLKKKENFPVAVDFFIGEVIFSITASLTAIVLQQPWNARFFLVLIVSCSLLSASRIKQRVLLFQPIRFDWKVLPFVFICFGCIFFHFFYSFYKPSEWDEVSYHMPVIKEIAAGKVHFPLLATSPYNNFYAPFSTFYGSLPYGSESFAVVPFLLSGKNVSAAHLTYFLNFLFFLSFLWFFLKKLYHLDLYTYLALCIFLLTNFGFVSILSSGLIDINVMIYQFMAVAFLILGKKDEDEKLAVISAFLMGFALGQKFTTLYIVPLYAVLFIVWFSNLGRRLFLTLQCVLCGIAASGIWYLKNILLYRNPTFPLYFGHPGISQDMYTFIVETMITGIKTPVTLKSFFLTLRLSYINETSTVIVFGLLVIVIISRKIRWRWWDLTLLGFAITFYVVMFVFGSQVSRYVLLTPLCIHIVASQFLQKRKILTAVLVVVVLLALRKNSLQFDLWQSRIKNLPYVFGPEYAPTDTRTIGCAANIYTYMHNNTLTGNKILNFWDPYAANYYADAALFYTLPNNIDYDHFSIPEQVHYVFVNAELRTAMVTHAAYHRDIQPEKRSELEQHILANKKPIFTKDSCQLYQL